MKVKKIVVVGAGPAGMMSAIRAAQLAQDVTLLEKNSIPGKKLLLSGKGRCNLTNNCSLNTFLERFSGRAQFLRDAFKKFFNLELIKFFEERGLRLKVERQMRVFPDTDRSQSIVEILKKELDKFKVRGLYDSPMKDLLIRDGRVKGVLLADSRIIPAERVILACGGASYSFTGSDGAALALARKLGHHIVALRPGLVPLVCAGDIPKKLEGLTLKNIRLVFSVSENRPSCHDVISEIGEMLFTADGISGPLVFALSGKVADWLAEGKKVCAQIDLKPALSKEQLHQRLLREFKAGGRKSLKNMLKALLPLRLSDVFIKLAGIDPRKSSSQVTQLERERMVSLLKALRFDIIKTRPLEEAMVTRGGVSLKEINPRTMESRLVRGLYFAGEMIDVDADTGGFNLQAAFSTGYLAGESAALS